MGKKTKAIKVTDQGKPWEKRKNSYQYEAIRRANKTILIVCEGQTEEWYPICKMCQFARAIQDELSTCHRRNCKK